MQLTAPAGIAERSRSLRTWAVVALIVLVHFGLVWGFQRLAPEGYVSPGRNPGTVVGGVFFLFWSAVLAASARWPAESAVFAFLNRRQNAGFLAVIFALVGLVLLLAGLGVFG